MKKFSIQIFILLLCGGGLIADYVADREAAVKLFQEKKYEDALNAFSQMAQGKVTDFQKSDAMEQGVLCLIEMKQWDRAAELAQKNPLKPVAKLCQMRILKARRKDKELIEMFGVEDIDSWPDNLKGDALVIRGTAAFKMENAKLAEADLSNAVKYINHPVHKAGVLTLLGDTYQNLLKNDEKAVETYRRVYNTKSGTRQIRAAFPVVNILLKQGKTDEALKELQQFESLPKKEEWEGKLLCAKGKILAAAGKKDEAVACYKKALTMKGMSSKEKKDCEKMIKELLTGEVQEGTQIKRKIKKGK